MNTLLDTMVSSYQTNTIYEKKNAIKEVMQELVLCGLSRAGFFKLAAFYGGTALRIFYGLDRFSEDLDFSLMSPNDDFDMKKYFPILEKEIASFGLTVKIDTKDKSIDSHIQSAFLKGNTKEHLLKFYPSDVASVGVSSNEVIKIKFEIDVNPPPYASFERKYRLRPMPYEVNLYDESSLFAGKIHAVLGRLWKNRIKGRDLYDYVFYLSRNTKLNIKHLEARLVQSGHLDEMKNITPEDVKMMLCKRFDEVDFEQAKKDVLPFIKEPAILDIWSTDFFKQITESLQATDC